MKLNELMLSLAPYHQLNDMKVEDENGIWYEIVEINATPSAVVIKVKRRRPEEESPK